MTRRDESTQPTGVVPGRQSVFANVFADHPSPVVWSLAFLATLGATRPTASEAAEPTAPTVLEITLRSEHERSGDFDALARHWLHAASEHQNDWRTELLLRRLVKIRSDLRDEGALIEAAEPILDSWAGIPIGKVLLSRLVGDLHHRRGNFEAQRRWHDGHGFVHHWLVAGPFGKGDGSLSIQPYEPEERLALDPPYVADWQALTWHPYSTSPRSPGIRPLDFVRPRRGIVYLLAQVHALDDYDATLHYGTSGSVRLWLNDTLIVDDNATDEFLPDKRRVGVRLAAGWNRILVKTRDSLLVRLTAPDGRPLEGQLDAEDGRVIHPLPETLPPPYRGDERGGAMTTWAEWLEQLEDEAETDTEDAAALLRDARVGFAYLSAFYGRQDLAVHAAGLAAAEAADDPFVGYHCGRLFHATKHLPFQTAKDRAKQAFEAAIDKDPLFVPAYSSLAEILASDEKFAAAATLIDQALARNPAFLRGLRRQKSIFRQAEWLEEEMRVTRAMADVAPSITTPALFWASYYDERGNPQRALEHLHAALERYPGQSLLLKEIARLEARLGRADAAVAAARRRVVLTSARRGPREDLAHLLAQLDRIAEAIEVLGELRRQYPLDAQYAIELGKLQLQQENEQEANTSFRDALRLAPGDLSLRRHLTESNENVSPFWARFDERLEDWIQLVPTSGPLTEKASSVAVLDISVLEIAADGSWDEYVHQAFKLLSEESKDDLAEVTARGEVVRLRTLLPDGRSLEPVAAEGEGKFVMPGLEAGAFVEFAYQVANAHREGRAFRQPSFFFQDPSFKQAFLLSRYVVIHPGGEDYRFLEPQPGTAGGTLTRVEREVRRLPDGRTAVIFEARNAPRVEPERRMPPPPLYLPNVQIAEQKSWPQVAGLLRDRLGRTTRLTPELVELANAIVEDVESPLDQARALYDHVNELIPKQSRNLAAHRVLLEKSGNRTTLFKALLDALRIPSDWAFLRPPEMPGTNLHWDTPRTDLFSARNLFVCLEAEDSKDRIYISLASRNTPFAKVPEHLEGGTALLIGRTGHRLISLARGDPRRYATSVDGTVALSSGTDADVSLTVRDRRSGAMAQKDRFRTIRGFQKGVVLQALANRLFPGARLKRGDFTGLEDPEAPFAIELELSAPNFLQRSGDDLLLKSVLNPAQLVANYCGRTERKHPFQLTGQHVIVDRVRVTPGALQLVRLPTDATLSCELGTYSLSYGKDEDGVVVERELTLRPGRIEPANFAAFVSFCQAADTAEKESLIFRAPATEPGSE